MLRYLIDWGAASKQSTCIFEYVSLISTCARKYQTLPQWVMLGKISDAVLTI